jgi:3-methyladenine DNA glycosylase AlkD
MARYGIEAKRAFGVPMGTLGSLSKRLGKDHALALALWESGWYEARLLAALVGDPERVTRRQMNAWASSFEIGIGAAVTRRPLPHHRAYGSVHGGSSWLR